MSMKKLYYLMRILHEKLVINNPNAPYPKIPLHKFILKLWLTKLYIFSNNLLFCICITSNNLI